MRLLLILNMLLLNKICSIAQVLSLQHISLKTGRELNVYMFYNRLFQVLCPGGMVYQNASYGIWENLGFQSNDVTSRKTSTS